MSLYDRVIKHLLDKSILRQLSAQPDSSLRAKK